MSGQSMRIIEVSGDPFERGRLYGEQAADLIAQAIEYYQEAFLKQVGMGWDAVCDYVAQWYPLIDSTCPELLTEMRGVAAGAGRSANEILALNVRGEFIYDLGSQRSARQRQEEDEDSVDGCTSYFLSGAAAGAAGHSLIGQNWDWRHSTRQQTLIVRIVQDPLPTIIMQLEAGQIGRHGANSAGIGLNANGLGGRFGSEIGLPQTFIRRLVLNQSSLSDALKVLVNTRPHISSNALLGHRSGYAIDLETTPDGIGWVYPEQDMLVHANHYQAELPAQLRGRYRPISPDSLLRLPRAQRRLAEVSVAQTPAEAVAAVHAAMSDHLGYPDSLCAHPDVRREAYRQWSTLLSSCVDLTSGEYHITEGTPCENDHRLLPWNVYDGPGPHPQEADLS
ncbi:MAG: C45 family autoproteolytic acyltransferase/hydrolase [Brevibacterium aurantiacum]|uniref:C45 family autoproteolytic acyltransferase/hydolase n=1 Tax=Brevibacterium aurantiacum TaxID=273384 RepID=UPI003F90240E